jgi:hypothetical protein
VQSLKLEQLQQVWENVRKDRYAQRALTKLKRDGFDIARLSPRDASFRTATWADYIAALPFLPNRATRRQLHHSAELRKYRRLIRLLRGLVSKMSDPFCEITLLSEKDHDYTSIPKQLLDTADFLEHFLSWNWCTRERNARNIVIAVLRSEIRFRTDRPHDAELSVLIDAVFRAAGMQEGWHMDPTALDRIEKREKEGRVKAIKRLRSHGNGRHMFYF